MGMHLCLRTSEGLDESDCMAQFAVVLLNPDSRERRQNPNSTKGNVPTPTVTTPDTHISPKTV